MNAAKIFTLVWSFVLMALVLLLQVYVMQLHWWFSILYALLAILLPLLYIFKRLVQAQTSKDYHYVSSVIKWVMFTGIVSMIFVKIYL
jgi:4-hydroxybenzoate polyprenyltransferase